MPSGSRLTGTDSISGHRVSDLYAGASTCNVAATFSIVARLTLEAGESSVPASAVPVSDADEASEAAWRVSVGVTDRDLPVMPHRPLGLTCAPRSAALCSSAQSRRPQSELPGGRSLLLREHEFTCTAKKAANLISTAKKDCAAKDGAGDSSDTWTAAYKDLFLENT